MKKLILALLLLFTFIFSCENEAVNFDPSTIEQPNSIDEPDPIDEPSTNELFTVSGTISVNNVAQSNATITLTRSTDNTVYTTNSDTAGNFSIDVLGGSYEIVVNITFPDGSFVYRTYTTDVNQNTVIETEDTIEPVTLFTPTNTTTDGFTLNWSEYGSTNFIEYKLYSHTSPEIDEDSGTLIYTGNAITDISFLVTENLVATETYYYRVFVSDNTGQIAGSNVIDVTIEDGSLIKNGGFEETAAVPPSFWAFNPTVGAIANGNGVTVTNSEFYSGNQSVSIIPTIDGANGNAYETGISQRILTTSLISDARYKISFYMKYTTSAGATPINFRSNVFSGSSDYVGLFELTSFPDNDTWEFYEYEITMPSTLDINDYFITFELSSGVMNIGYNFWLDDINMIRIP